MSRASQSPPAARGRGIAGIFTVVFLLLSYFAVMSAAGTGGLGIYVVTFVHMLLLAAIVAPYVFAVVFLGGGDSS